MMSRFLSKKKKIGKSFLGLRNPTRRVEVNRIFASKSTAQKLSLKHSTLILPLKNKNQSNINSINQSEN